MPRREARPGVSSSSPASRVTPTPMATWADQNPRGSFTYRCSLWPSTCEIWRRRRGRQEGSGVREAAECGPAPEGVVEDAGRTFYRDLGMFYEYLAVFCERFMVF
ncbi:hypothetical protein E2C01_078944 [Portunus trituberculatus]|uniref:Uncharacterized protein n=1 Tax=Portunus trituberculatus TaxID=210409 RepID=A0A5B7IP19_PORTR|nr:hypothetical protein [Portunus trituberculatus]